MRTKENIQRVAGCLRADGRADEISFGYYRPFIYGNKSRGLARLKFWKSGRWLKRMFGKNYREV